MNLLQLWSGEGLTEDSPGEASWAQARAPRKWGLGKSLHPPCGFRNVELGPRCVQALEG